MGEGDCLTRPINNEDQDYCSTREEVLCMDRRLHLGISLHLPTDVDLKAGIRRIWPIHRPQNASKQDRLLCSNIFQFHFPSLSPPCYVWLIIIKGILSLSRFISCTYA